MNKEYLEAFNRIALHTEYDNDGSYDCLNFEDDCKLVDNALQRLDQIDNANPNEALKCLEENLECYSKPICNGSMVKNEYVGDYWHYCINNEKIKDALLKVQEMEEENTRAFGKDIINLNKTLKQPIDKPIFYVGRYGNKYIVPQNLFEEQCNILIIIDEKNVDILDVKIYENYKHYCRAKEDSKLRKDWWLTLEEFELLKKYVNRGE